MENQTKKSNKAAIITIIVVLVALLVTGIVGVVLSKTFLYRKLYNTLNKCIATTMETGKNNFSATIKGNVDFIDNSPEYKEIGDFLNKVDFKLSLQNDQKELLTLLEAKDRETDEVYLNATLDTMLEKDGMYLKCEQLSEQWIDLLDNKEIKEKYLELKNDLEGNEEKTELDKELTQEIIKEIVDDISNINIVKTKDEYEYKGKKVKATKNSICIEKSRIENLVLKIIEKYENEKTSNVEIEDEEEFDLDFNSIEEEDIIDEDFLNKAFNDINNDEDDYIDDGEEDTSDYEYLTINFYTSGWLRKKIIGFSSELLYCEDEDVLDCDCEGESYKEAEVKVVVKDENEFDIICEKYDLTAIKNPDKLDADAVVQKINVNVKVNNENSVVFKIYMEKEGLKYATINLEVEIGKFDGIKEEIDADKVISVNSISLDKIQDTKLFAQFNSVKEADKKLEEERITAEAEEKEKQQNELDKAAKQLEESTKEITKQLNNSTFELLKGNNVSYNNVKVLIEAIDQANSLRNAGITLYIDGETVSVESASEKINKDSRYTVSLQYNNEGETIGIEVNTNR